MEDLIKNPWIAALIVFVTQVIFITFRTLNVMYTAEKKLWATIFTGSVIGIAWLITIAVGVNSVMRLEWQPIIAHILGGALGVYWGFKSKK